MHSFPFQPSDKDGPVFQEPWEAQAFALVVALHGAGRFTWEEWATTLSEEIVLAKKLGDPDLGDTYYQHWLNALEKMALQKNFSTNSEVHARSEQWRQAYLSTPHGQPVKLK